MTECELCGNETKQLMICAECQGEIVEEHEEMQNTKVRLK